MTLWFGFFAVFFLIGSFPTAYLVAKLTRGLDIRERGSGNVGTTNALRVLGLGPGLFVFAVDFMKGFFPIFLVNRYGGAGADDWQWTWLGLAPVVGHIFCPFLKFKGGKGVATGGGVLLAGFPILFLVCIMAWFCIFLITKIISITSILSIGSVIITSFIFRLDTASIFYLCILGFIIIAMHGQNIRRLLRGEEKKIC